MKPNIHFLSYADDRFGRKGGRYRQTQIAVAELMLAHPDIADVLSFTQDDLTGTEFYEKHKDLLEKGITQAAGNMQKPFFVRKALGMVPENSYVLYHDISAEIWDLNLDYIQWPLRLHARMCDQNEGVLLANAGQDATYCLHRHYTSPTCMRLMQVERFKDCVQECASWVLFRNSPSVRNLVDEWLAYNTNEDCASYLKNKLVDQSMEPEFIEHRGDQSILTLLLRKYQLTNLMETPHKNVFSVYWAGL